MAGAYIQTPAMTRYDPSSDPTRQLFQQHKSATSLTSQQQQQQQQSQQLATTNAQQQQPAQAQQQQSQSVQPVQRAARTINDVLQRDANYPDLDTYLKRNYQFSTTAATNTYTL